MKYEANWTNWTFSNLNFNFLKFQIDLSFATVFISKNKALIIFHCKCKFCIFKRMLIIIEICSLWGSYFLFGLYFKSQFLLHFTWNWMFLTCKILRNAPLQLIYKVYTLRFWGNAFICIRLNDNKALKNKGTHLFQFIVLTLGFTNIKTPFTDIWIQNIWDVEDKSLK